MSRICKQCGESISATRLTALPNTRVCINCSTEKKVTGHMTWEHKTAPTFQLVTPKQHEELQKFARKGPHAQLPMSSKSRAELTVEDRNLSRPAESVPVQEWNPKLSTIPPSRCHPDRPKATADGKCIECALAWYKVRLK